MYIVPHLPEIIKLIRDKPIVLVVAPTGSGKTIGMPMALAAKNVRCFVSVPTVVTAMGLVSHQKAVQLGKNPDVDPNKIVGFAYEGKAAYNNNHKIIYATAGHVRRKLLSYFNEGVVKNIDFCDVLFVDEIHSGTIDNTMILSLWAAAASAGVNVPRLLLASATPIPLFLPYATFEVAMQSLKVEIKYFSRDFELDSKDRFIEAGKLCAEVHLNTPVDSGHILVFVPGKPEADQVYGEISKRLILLNDQNKIPVISVIYSGVLADDLTRTLGPVGPNERKIVISTNIAEAGVTIPDVGHVIDTLTEKRAETSLSGGMKLVLHYISKDSAKQRLGRTGRTREGICYRMCTQETFDKMEHHRPPEVERVPIYDAVMELLDVGLVPANILRGVDLRKIETSVNLLIALEMAVREKDQIKVTDKGHFAPKFPMSVRNTSFLWDWIHSGYDYFHGIVVASIIDGYGPSYFWIPRREMNQSQEVYTKLRESHKKKYFYKFRDDNDLGTALNMWSDYAKYVQGEFENIGKMKDWCVINSINAKKFKDLVGNVLKCTKVLSMLGKNVHMSPLITKDTLQKSAPILQKSYSDRILYHRSGSKYFNNLTKQEYLLETRDSVSKMAELKPEVIIGLAVNEITNNGRSMRMISFSVRGFGKLKELELQDSKFANKAILKPGQELVGKPANSKLTDLESNNMILRKLELLNSIDIDDKTVRSSLNKTSKDAELLVSDISTETNSSINKIKEIVSEISDMEKDSNVMDAVIQEAKQKIDELSNKADSIIDDIVKNNEEIVRSKSPRSKSLTQRTSYRPIPLNKYIISRTNYAIDDTGNTTKVAEDSSLNIEFSRWLVMRKIEKYFSDNIEQAKNTYEALNCLERWILSVANEISTITNYNGDPIVNDQFLNKDNVHMRKFILEMKEKNFSEAIVENLSNFLIDSLKDWLNTSIPQDKYTISIATDLMLVENTSGDIFVKSFTPGRLEILANSGNFVDIARMSLRYACILPSGQQWNIPTSVYRYLTNEGINIECFASPLNSQMLLVSKDAHFCSLFPDTDHVFGSLGSFFALKPNNVKIMANPPYVEELMNKMAKHIENCFLEADSLFVISCVPNWRDAEYMRIFKNSNFLKRVIVLGPNEYYYEDSTNNKRISANFTTCLFVLTKGYENIDYQQMESELRKNFSA